jgi:bifunctional non-homologous end joining protein LigD
VVEVAYGDWTSDGRLRHPVYMGQRTDVDAGAVVRP